MDMVPAIWKYLPIDILEMIFLWLPLSMIIRLKMVCKGWSRIVSEKISSHNGNTIKRKNMEFWLVLALLIDIGSLAITLAKKENVHLFLSKS